MDDALGTARSRVLEAYEQACRREEVEADAWVVEALNDWAVHCRVNRRPPTMPRAEDDVSSVRKYAVLTTLRTAREHGVVVPAEIVAALKAWAEKRTG